MQKLIFLAILFFTVPAFGQLDSARLLADTMALNTSKDKLEDVAKKIIDNKESQINEELSKIREKEEELRRLDRDVRRNEREIENKKKEIRDLKDNTARLKKEEEETKAVLQAAVKEYDSIKFKIVQMRKDSATLIQQQDTIKKKTDSLVNKTNATQAEYNKLLVEIAKKEDSLEAIAKIRLKSNIIVLRGDPEKYKPTYAVKALLSQYGNQKASLSDISSAMADSKNSIRADSQKVENIHLFVKEGRIVEIIVKTDNGIFRNTRAQIDLVHFSERRYADKLFKDDEDPDSEVRSFIFPGDAISYEPIRSFGDIPYSEFEITLTPDSAGNTYIIRESTSINTYFEVAAFTDINGIAGNANGLAQITASARFITSTRNWLNKTLMGLQYISFNGGLSKFDNDFKGTFISNTDSVNRKDLFQRAQYAVGVKVNLLRAVRSPYPNLLFNDFQLNAGFNFLGSKIADTLLKSNDTLFRTVTHNQFYIEPTVNFSRQKNFNMTFSIPVFYQNLKQSSGIANLGWEWWVCPSINLMYFSKRDSKSKIFFRYNHFINLSNKKQAFNQMQLGYAANLTNIMQGK